MKEINSKDYHDFVFKDGKFVGEFEQMYQKSENIPWYQDRDPDRIDCQVAADILTVAQPYKSMIEIGAGLGYFADFMLQRVQIENYLGTDISNTAILKAKQNFPELNFDLLDVTKSLCNTKWEKQQFDILVIRATFWYLVHEIDLVVKNLTSLVKTGGYIFISQNFPPLDKPFIGKEILPNPESLLKRFEKNFDMKVVNQLDDKTHDGGNDNWIMFLGQKCI